MKGQNLISCDATHSSRQNSLEYVIKSMHFFQADTRVGLYELFILCWPVFRNVLQLTGGKEQAGVIMFFLKRPNISVSGLVCVSAD